MQVMGPGRPLSLTLIPIEALDKGGCQALVGDFTGIDIVLFVL